MINQYLKSIPILLVGVFLYATDRDICEIPVENQEGWNLVGLPVYVSDNFYQTLFTYSIEGTLYSFDGGYNIETNLIQGKGYWLRFSEDQTDTLIGECVDGFTISMSEGWNLISVVSRPVSVDDIIDPAGIIVEGTVYGFSGGYYEPTVLEPGIGYWVRCYNEGEIIIPEITVTDIDGNVYETVQIGDQLWMKENLKVTHYNNGNEIRYVQSESSEPNVWTNLSTGAYGYYNDDLSHQETYGNLYNWYAVETGNLAPEGWHVPTEDEIKELEIYLGMCEGSSNGCVGAWYWRGTNEGSKLAGMVDLWNDGNLVNNPEFGTSGFNLLPGGYRLGYDGYYNGMGLVGYFWSSTEYNSYGAWYRVLNYDYSEIGRYYFSKKVGFSVRCVRD